MKDKSFIKDIRFDRETITCAVTLLFFFVFSDFFSFNGRSVFSSVVCIILGLCFCAIYCLSTRHVMSQLDNRMGTAAFVLLYCDILMYGYMFGTPDVMRCLSVVLFAVSAICLFVGKLAFISVVTIIISSIYTPSLAVILLLLLISSCSAKQKVTYIYPFISTIGCVVHLLLYHHRNYTFDNLKFSLLSSDYLFFDTKEALRILSFVPIILFFGMLWIKSALKQKSRFTQICYILPLVFSVMFASLLPFAKTFMGPVFINTVFLLFFINRKDKSVTDTFNKMINYLSAHPLLTIPLILSFVVSPLFATDTFGSLYAKIDIIY